MTISVYIDVENTCSVSFISGIQRVTRELVFRLKKTSGFRFVPVMHCAVCSQWFDCEIQEPTRESSPSSLKGKISRTGKKLLPDRWFLAGKSIYKFLEHQTKKHSPDNAIHFEPGSIFFDIDSSWHNQYKRSLLLPRLVDQSVTIVTLHHDAIPVLMPEVCHPDTVTLFQDHFQAHLQYSSLFICNSRATQADLLRLAQSRFPGRQVRSDVVRFGDFELGNLPSPALDIVSAIPGKFALCVGTLEPRKNHQTLIEAFNIVCGINPDFSLVLVGRKGWKADEIVEKIKSHPLYGSRLLWFHDLGDNQLSSLYDAAYVNILVSQYEGFGLPVSEALSRGCVTIVSNCGAMLEIGGDYVDPVDPMNSRMLADSILDYLADPDSYDKRKQLIKSRKQYLWEDTAQQISKSLTEIADVRV